MRVGTEWLVDAEGCSAELLRDAGAVRGVCRQIITELDLHVVGDGVCHPFPPPGGITALYLLTESHLACHTYPEYGVATFNLYCCRPRPRGEWERWLRELLGAERVRVRVVPRGEEAVVAAAREQRPW
jgi:S-adenosylmethionine decarboxylase